MSVHEQLEAALGYRFRQPELLRLALTHPSMTHEAGEMENNQRLEFLGDAVLQLCLTRELYDRFTDADEGSLTKGRARLVNQTSLAERALHLNLGEYLIMSRGEETNGGRQRPSILADAFEAVIGAVFLDGGQDCAFSTIVKQFRPQLENMDELPKVENPKGALQELLQASSIEAPRYEVISASGPDHDRNFECAVWHSGRELARGTGKSKKAAEVAAAAAALDLLREKKTGP
ncbi:MAG: ribonuclease III [Verrucomicrobiota bacterium]